ncbi:Probable aldo-keto reductase 6 [Chlamydiales bacterium SCGC AB-751-O23]|jgi:aryl-alcohol dehydrogenase-like predicted oxidoreductase|nr:Probable aldo-keto reductase 6 [Chlamydiales bacterium SCGC AB-751-O23]
MHHRQLGSTGTKLSSIGLGAWLLSEKGRPTEENAIEVIHSSLNQGVNLIDTANAYCLNDTEIGHNERLIKKALESWKETHSVYVATKGGCTRPDGAWGRNGKKQHLLEACKKSLEDLGIDQIFLYQLHGPGSNCPFEESIEALAELKQKGLVKYLGLSNVSLEQLNQAQAVTRIESVQNCFNLYSTEDLTNGLIKACEAQRVTYIAYSPVGSRPKHVDMTKGELLQKLSLKYKVSSYQVLLAWVLHLSKNMIAISGSTRVESAEDSPKAMGLSLEKEDLFLLDKFSLKGGLV